MSNLIFIDVDGVLAENKFQITKDGEIYSKTFNCKDSRAIRELVANGYEVHIITASGWPGSKKYCEKLKVFYHVDRTKDVKSIAKENSYIAVGDDVWDLVMLKGAKEAYCPSDADKSVLSLPGITILESKGGGGVIAELITLLL